MGKKSVEDRYHLLEFEKPAKNRPPRCLPHVLKAVLKRQWRLIGKPERDKR
jgi:hypothetical protein